MSTCRKHSHAPIVLGGAGYSIFPESALAFADRSHKNSSQDAVIYMETYGTMQQRWAADFLKAKTGGRESGGTGFDPNNGDGTQFGFINVARAGATSRCARNTGLYSTSQPRRLVIQATSSTLETK